jgi:type IX secretion system PorP/SprF family membrane protein
MKKIFSIILFQLVMGAIHAQQDPLYSQYLNNPFVINPAYGGLTNNLNASVSYRQQWAGFEGSPKTINFNASMSLFDNTMGAGLMVVSDQIGANTTNEVFATYSYRIQLDQTKTLSFGLQAGASNYQTDNDKLNPQNPSDPFYTGTISEFKPSFGAGVILTSDKFFLSLSVPRMLKSNFEEEGVQTTLYAQHFYGLASYLFFLSERVRFKPSALVKYVSGAPLSVDVNASVIFHENYQAGVLTRNFNTYGFFVQAFVKNSLRFGYVFELPTAKSVGTNFTTHEVTLGIRMTPLRFHSNDSVFSF